MIGSGLRKLAAEHGFTITDGIAYGLMDGYTLTLNEGMGTKTLGIAATMRDDLAAEGFCALLTQNKGQYQIAQASRTPYGFLVVFTDNWGTMKRMRAFIPFVIEQLKLAGGQGMETCPVCRQALGDGSVAAVNMSVAFRAHRSCYERVQRLAEEQAEQRKSEPKNIGRGAIGAFLGGIIGSIPWMIAENLGWFVGWLGYLIGLAASKGYALLGGKPSRAKRWIVLLAVIFSVAFSSLVSIGVGLAIAISEGGTPFEYRHIPALIIFFLSDPEMLVSTTVNFVIGLVFAGIGCLSMFRELGAESNNAQVQVKLLGQ